MELTPDDDLLLHRSPYTLLEPGEPSAHPRFFERHWNVWHDDTGDLVLAVGGSTYPLIGRTEAYAVATLRGHQVSVRVTRPADDEPLANPPLRSEVVEGLRRWRHTLEPGQWGFSYDLSWTDTHRPAYAAAWGPEPEGGEERKVTAGFEGFGTVTGWVQVGDERIEWAPGDAHGTRDRHWGVGRAGRTKKAGWKGGIWIDLGDVGLWGKALLRPLTGPPGAPGKVARVDRRLRFDDTQLVVEGVVDLTFDDGTTRSLHLERLGQQTAYMRCGFYGGTPHSDVHHADHEGPLAVEWDSFDLHDPASRLLLRGLDEHHCRVTWDGGSTTGILQPVEPDVYDACVAGAPGWSLL